MSFVEARDRLRKWAHEPTYKNPGELRADVRELLDTLDKATVALQTCLHQLGEEGYFSDPDYPEIDEALVLYERIVGA